MVTCCRSSKSPTRASERLAHLRLTDLSLGAGLIFIAAGASWLHPRHHPIGCPPVLSPLHPFRCLSSHLTWDLYHQPPIIHSTTQPSRPLLPLVWLPCSYCGKPPILGALVKILPTPCAPRHVLPATFPGLLLSSDLHPPPHYGRF
jgi:hypothetical protein